ncbi:12953_t:CDS:2 [Gigaspora margarita]|uniref:12953_t:CDS:1 n=1 Tax=Gigaspora margarita TaxID=4874 RepID=A0ABN7W111_GIGMA|nr:12953_t:CDS:2 [Gigaspora margarita]
MVGINTRETDCTDVKWIEYCNIPQIHDNKTPSDLIKWIWKCLMYFRENNLLPIERMERHWKFSCTGNKYCSVSYNEYLLKVKKKSISGYDYNNEYALYRYGFWMQNAIKKIEYAREIGKKIQAVNVIQQKWLEYFYRPNGLCATELAQHYQLLWVVQEEMR